MRYSVRDKVSLSQRVVTPEGYLYAPATIGRCGIQVYTRGELGLDGDSSAPVRLMRTPEEVFRPETVASFENKPITYRHPDRGVDAGTWSELAKGHVRDVAKAPGELLGGTTWVMDAEQVERVFKGDAYLSCGYSFELDLTPGTSPDGQPFDGYQRSILGDHLAILDSQVDSPRGGPICRIGDEDSKQKGPKMAMKKLAVDGLPKFEIDELAAESIELHIKKLATDRDQVIADFDKYVDEAKKKATAADAKVAELTGKLTAKDAELAKAKEDLEKAHAVDIDALVADRAKVIADAKTLAPELEAKGTSHEIRKAAITAACSDETNKAVADQLFGADGIEKASDADVAKVFGVLLALPKQEALRAQDAAIGRALGTGSDTAVTGPVEVLDGIPESRKTAA